MERLTEYDEFGNAEFVGIDNTKLYKKLVCDENVALTIATHKLAKLEDVLEKYGIESADGLNTVLIYSKIMSSENLKIETELAELKEKQTQYENIEEEIGCDIEIFWKVYRKLSGHGKDDIHLCSIFNNEIVEIMPTAIISGTYGNYPQDCSFKYLVWNKISESYNETYSYFHFHDYNKEWFLSKEEAEQKLAEIKGNEDE